MEYQIEVNLRKRDSNKSSLIPSVPMRIFRDFFIRLSQFLLNITYEILRKNLSLFDKSNSILYKQTIFFKYSFFLHLTAKNNW